MAMTTLPPILISENALDPKLITDVRESVGSMPIHRDRFSCFVSSNNDAVPSLWQDFLDIVGLMVREPYQRGVSHMTLLEPGPVDVNETHRDKGSATTLNCVALVADADESHQLEFFAEDDPYETNPIRFPNNHVIVWTKHLHRRRLGLAAPRRVFLSANLGLDE